MASTHRRWAAATIGLSVVAHLGVLALLALGHPTLPQFEPEPVFEVTMAPLMMRPHSRPVASPQLRETERLRPRRVAPSAAPLTVAPLITTDAPDAPPPEPAAAVNLRNALRRGAAGCANVDAARLTPAERDACAERWGAGAKDAPFYEPPMSRDKRLAFDQAAEKKAAYQRYKRQNIPSGAEAGGLAMKAMPEVWTPHD